MPLIDIKDIVPERNIWIISPHYDDVPLVLGGYLDALAAGGLAGSKCIRVIQVFSRSTYQARDDEGNRNTSLARIQYATGIRLMEDLNCLDDLLGHGNYDYEIKAERECVLRQKAWKDGEAFEFPHGNRENFDDEDWQIHARVTRYARQWLTQEDTALVLPLCVKEHVDHVIIREAVLDVMDELGDQASSRVCFGEDQPYTGLADPHDTEVAEAFIGERDLEPLDYVVDVDRKADVVQRHYPTQVEASYMEGIRSRAKQLAGMHGLTQGVERIYRKRR